MEQPNLSLINEITGGDKDFEKNLLDIIKKEFPVEVALFEQQISAEKYNEASKTVHKLKHKISLLGLREAAILSTNFENQLKKGNMELHVHFQKILSKIHVYLNL